MKYQFTNLQTGKPCCTTDDINHLCANCRRQATRAAAPTVAAARPVAVPPIEDAPELPNLVATVNARRNGQTQFNLDAPVFGGGVRPYPVTVAAAHEIIDEPPSLADAVKARRAR